MATKMKQRDAWETAVRALRLHFLQGNSQIDNIEEWIDEQVSTVLKTIRSTSKGRTDALVARVVGRGQHVPQRSNMTGIFIYDWRNNEKPAGVAVAFEEGESHCSCYNVGDLSSPFDWDVSIVEREKDLTKDEAWRLTEELSRSVPFILGLRNIVDG